MKRKLLKFIFLFAFSAGCGSAAAQTFYVCEGSDTRTASELTLTDRTQLNTAAIDSITLSVPQGQRFVGGDISMLARYESQKAQYKDKDGKAIDDLITYLGQQGWNTLRVRLFVDPTKSSDQKQCFQNLDYVTTLGQRIKAAGMLFMLDFHYSDTWADPAAQWTPAAWASLSDAQLQTKVYEYTRDCLRQLNRAGASPDFIQTGNEISYGMLWGTQANANDGKTNRCFSTSAQTNWDRFFALLRQATRACREECPRAQLIIHSERVPRPQVLTDYFDRLRSAAIDYDIIGLSYYSYFHGSLDALETALRQLTAKNYGKPIQIVEMGYPFKWAVGGTTFDYTATYPLTDDGQRQFVADLIARLKKYPQVNGLSWWYAEANAYGCNGNLSSGWYNAGLFDNNTGRALKALYELQNFK